MHAPWPRFVYLGLTLACSLAPTAVVAEAESAAQKAITDAAVEQRQAIAFDGSVFAGPGYERLITAGKNADFFLIGEEHGIAENPRLAAQLFADLAPAGYRRLAIEISPPMATLVDGVLARDGLNGLEELFASPGHKPAFFGMREEAQMLAAIRRVVPAGEPAFWGVDYEVAGDLALLRRLESMAMPEAAKTSVKALVDACAVGWAQLVETGDPRHLFSFTGDPRMVRDVKQAWPDRSDDAAAILDAIEETLEINRLWMAGRGYDSNHRRAGYFRSNFLTHWRNVRGNADVPKVMAKLGANHLVRGRNNTRTFDLGSLLPELADIEGRAMFSMMVVPGRGSAVAVLNPATWTYEPAPPKDNYLEGLEPLLAAAHPDVFTLIDLRPLRAVAASREKQLHPALVRTVLGFDMLLVMSGSTASEDFP